eukprot:14061318-Alexandrium_andersonii.AAC.1
MGGRRGRSVHGVVDMLAGVWRVVGCRVGRAGLGRGVHSSVGLHQRRAPCDGAGHRYEVFLVPWSGSVCVRARGRGARRRPVD